MFSILVAAFALMTSAARAQSYGPDEQVLTIGAAEFQPMVLPASDIESDGYFYFAIGSYLAPVSLPEGAGITGMCLYANDSDSGSGHTLETDLIAVKLVPGGESPRVMFLASFSLSIDGGYGVSCGTSTVTIRGKINVDNDGIPDRVAYYIYAHVQQPNSTPLGLGGVKITWKRQVSPLPSTPTFGDVPGTDPAVSEIEALAASGITAGCSGGNYCPDASLTRRQMAVFLAKALGLHWTD